MLLKIYTCQNTIKVIDNIDDVEIHLGEFKIDNYAQLYNAITHGPGMLRATRETPDVVESHDWDMNAPTSEAFTTPVNCNLVRFVDYLKEGKWHRVAIQYYAYLCNNDGKTISKVGTDVQYHQSPKAA